MTATCICITREDIGPGVPRVYAEWTAQQWRADCPTHGRYTLHNGDCREVMATLDENSIDAIVTDPPYELVEPRSVISFGAAMKNGRTDEGFRFVGIDLEPHYIEIARRRIARRHAIEPLPQRDEGQGVLL